MTLDGRVALVTGAARRLGRAIAGALAARGARVAVHYHRSGGEAEELVAAIRQADGTAEAFAADLALPAAVEDLAAAVTERLGPVDVLVNNASVFYPTPLATVGEGEWDDTMGVNLKAPYLLSLRLGRAMRTRGAGKIVSLADIAAFRPFRDYLPYSVSKAGLVALTEGLARLLAPEVQVNCIAPGPILPPEEWGEAERARVVARTPLARFGAPADVVAAVLYLVESDFVTGTTLVVDGGRALG